VTPGSQWQVHYKNQGFDLKFSPSAIVAKW
jgi:hypothetical protein